MKRIAASVLLVLALTASATADLTNPCTLTLQETSASRFSVQLTLPVIQGRVLKARPLLPDVCVIEGNADVQGDGSKVVRTWAMTCDPNDLVGTTIGVQGLLGTSLDVQLTIETLDGRKYVAQLRPTQAYYVVPPSPTMRSLAVEVGGAAVRQVLRRLELALLLLLCAFSGVRLRARFVSAAAFAMALALGQWLKTENWIQVSSFLPATLTAAMGLAIALSILRGEASRSRAGRWLLAVLMALVGVLSGGDGLPVQMVLSRSEQQIALIFSALGTMAGLALVILCTGRLHAAVAIWGQNVLVRWRFWVAYLGGVAACAIGLYQGTAPLFAGSLTPTVPLVTLLAAIALGSWCGAPSRPERFVLPHVAGCTLVLGMVLGLRGVSLPQTTLVVYGSVALVGLLFVWPVRWPGWAALVLVAVSSLYHGSHAVGVLRESVALPVAQATGLCVLLAFLFLVTYDHAPERRPGNMAVRLFGLSIALLAAWWRLAEYRQWAGEELVVDATMGFVRLPVLSILLAGCSREDVAEKGAKPTGRPVVYASNYPLQYFAQKISAPLVDVRLPVPRGQDPAFLAPTPEDVAALQKADLVVLNGAASGQVDDLGGGAGS
jgi:hydrogenase/urease accessory protein HupE